MKKTKIILSVYSILPIIPLALMVLSAHSGNVAYTCAMEFMALYMCLFAATHDMNVSLFNIFKFLVFLTEKDSEDKENEYED